VEFDERFSTEAACLAYLAAVRWPNGFVCPRCAGVEVWRKARGLMLCRACGLETSATAGTIFHKTRKPLRVWFQAMWSVTSQKYGANALGLQRTLGLGSYETAWTWLHKLRRTMIRPGRDRLSGAIEIDETYVGGSEAGVYGRETANKALVVVAAEVRGRATGRIRLRRVPDASTSSLRPFIVEVIEPGAEAITDGWRGYSGLPDLGYRHTIHNIKRSGRKAHEELPHVHRVASLLKRWLLGTHQGAVSHKHLDYYLDEFTFRFNRRASTHRGLLFFRLVESAVALQPTTHRELVAGAARATATTRARSNGS